MKSYPYIVVTNDLFEWQKSIIVIELSEKLEHFVLVLQTRDTTSKTKGMHISEIQAFDSCYKLDCIPNDRKRMIIEAEEILAKKREREREREQSLPLEMVDHLKNPNAKLEEWITEF